MRHRVAALLSVRKLPERVYGNDRYAHLAGNVSVCGGYQPLTADPCRAIRLPHLRLGDRPEVNAHHLEALAKVPDPEQATMPCTGAVRGLRWAEAAGLTVGALDSLLGRDAVICKDPAPLRTAGVRASHPVLLPGETHRGAVEGKVHVVHDGAFFDLGAGLTVRAAHYAWDLLDHQLDVRSAPLVVKDADVL